MEMFQTCAKYDLHPNFLKYLIKTNIINEDIKDEDLRRIFLVKMFFGMGMSANEAKLFFNCNSIICQLSILNNLRVKLLADVHEKQKDLDKLDFLIFDIKKKTKGE